MNSLGSHPRFSAGEITRESIAHPSVQPFSDDAVDSVDRGRKTRSAGPRASSIFQFADVLIGPGWTSFDSGKWVLVRRGL